MYCSNCGHELKDDAKFCSRCGAPAGLPDEPEYEIEEEGGYAPSDRSGDTAKLPQKNNKRKKYPWIILICAAAAVLILALVFFMRKAPESAEEEKKTESAAAESSVSDYPETFIPDTDGDGLADEDELKYGTNEILLDSDRDGVSDADEIGIWNTDPLNRDTDGDGADDATELWIGTDPGIPESEFTTVGQSDEINEIVPVRLEVQAVTDAEGAGTLSIEPQTDTSIPALMTCSYGYLAPAFELTCDGALDSALLTFSYDTSLGEDDPDFDPTIYWYNENNNELVEVEGQTRESGTVYVTVSHFSTYTLMDKSVIDRVIDLLPDFIDESSFMTDVNNDRIPDLYAEYINDGRLKYDNTDILVGMLDLYGDSDDWDGDGLKNGEEIGFRSYLNGKVQIVIYSNPAFGDTDGDNLDDYSETRLLNTSPLRYDRSGVSAYHQLEYDYNYNYASHKEDWGDGLVKFFDADKYGKAKACLIDYFFEYAPEDTIAKNAEDIERLANLNEITKYIGGIGNLISVAKDIHSVGNALNEIDYYGSDPEEKARQLCGDKKALIALRNSNQGQLILSSEKTMKSASGISKDFEDILSQDAFKSLEGTSETVKLIKNGVSVYKECTKKHVYSLRSQMEDYTRYSKTPGGPDKFKGGTALTVAKDVADAAEDIADLAATYAKLKVNAEAYTLYLELLCEIRDNSEYEYIASAAGDIIKIVTENGTDEFFDQLGAACSKSILMNVAEDLFDELAKKNPYAAVAKAFIEVYSISGLADQARYDIYFETMMDVSDGCKRILNRKVRTYGQTFSYYESDEAYVYKYLVQLAQSRIIGEYYFFQYCAEENLANWISSALSGKQPSYYLELFKNKAGRIYDSANRLKLVLSRNLPYYDLYYDAGVPEDHVRIPLSAERLFHNAAGKYTLTGYDNSWRTEFVLYENGAFTGVYTAEETGGSPDGGGSADRTIAERTFSGKFGIGDPVEDYAFKLTLDEYYYDGLDEYSYTEEAAGETILHICAPAVGLEDAEAFVIYGPETPPDEAGDPYMVTDYFIGSGDGNDLYYYFYREPMDLSVLGTYHFYKAAMSGAISIKDDSYVHEEDREEDYSNTITVSIERAQMVLTKNEKYLRTRDLEAEGEDYYKYNSDYIINRYMENGERHFADEEDYPLTLPLHLFPPGYFGEDVYYIGNEEYYFDTVRFEGDYLIVSVYTFEAYKEFTFIKDRN